MNAFDTADPVESLAAAIRAAWAGVTSLDGVTVVSGNAASALERFYGLFTEHAEASGALVIAVPTPDGDPLALLAAGVDCDTADVGSRAWEVAMALLDRTVEGRLVVLIVAAAERLDHSWLSAIEGLLRVETGGDRLLQIVLIGTSELRTLVARSAGARLPARKLHAVILPDAPDPFAAPERRDQLSIADPRSEHLDALWRSVESRVGLTVVIAASADDRRRVIEAFVAEATCVGTTLVSAERPVGDPIGQVAGALRRPDRDTGAAARSNLAVFLVEGAERADQRWLSRVARLLDLEDRRGKLVQVVLAGAPELVGVLREHAEAGLAQRARHEISLDEAGVVEAPDERPVPLAIEATVSPEASARAEAAAAAEPPVQAQSAVVEPERHERRHALWGASGALAAVVLLVAYWMCTAPRAIPTGPIVPMSAAQVPDAPVVRAPAARLIAAAEPVPPMPARAEPPPPAPVPSAEPAAPAFADVSPVVPAQEPPPAPAGRGTALAGLGDPAAEAFAVIEGRRGAPGLVLVAASGDTIPELYQRVYRGLVPPPYAAVLAANPRPVRPGTLVVFPAPPEGWAPR